VLESTVILLDLARGALELGHVHPAFKLSDDQAELVTLLAPQIDTDHQAEHWKSNVDAKHERGARWRRQAIKGPKVSEQ